MLKHLVNTLFRLLLIAGVGLFVFLLELVSLLRSKRAIPLEDKRLSFLFTGTFFSPNWINNHLRPLINNDRCSRIILVTTFPIVPINSKLEIVCPPALLQKLIGSVPSRLLFFVLISFCCRYDYIGGFHLLVNGLLSILLAKIHGTRSIYFCTGGPSEVQGGGFHARTRLFGVLKKENRMLEVLFHRSLMKCDVIVGMGQNTLQYFREIGVTSKLFDIPGGIDSTVFYPSNSEKQYDLILVGVLDIIKRVDLFLGVVKLVTDRIPMTTAVIVGDGILENDLRKLSFDLGISDKVTFAGYQTDVASWLRKAKVFVLTSQTEALPLAAMEAMSCGLPCVVPDVGELNTLVENDVNGYRVVNGSPYSYANDICKLLIDNERLNKFSSAALKTSKMYTIEKTSMRWDKLLSEII